jgi:hypothetical protein
MASYYLAYYTLSGSKTWRDAVTTDVAHGQRSAFACRPRTGYNLGQISWSLCEKASGGIVWEASK